MKKNIINRGGRLHIQTTYEGKRLRFSTKLKDTKENREYVLREYEKLIKDHLTPKQEVKPKAKENLEDFINKILERKKMTLKPRSIKFYMYLFQKINDFLGHKEISRINYEDIENFYEFLLKQKLSKSTIQAIVSCLKEVLNFAIREEKIVKNVVFHKKLNNLEVRENKPFCLEEMRYLLTLAEKYPKFFSNYLKIAFFTGMRVGEILALKWENIDLKNSIIKVEGTIGLKGEIGTPKTKSSKREVDVLPLLKQTLEEMEAQKQGKFIFVGDLNNLGFKIRLLWAKLLKEAGFEYRKLYITRHTFASIMLNAGEEPLWVSSQLGHKNLAITYAVYTKYMKNQKKQRAVFLEEAFNAPIKEINISENKKIEEIEEKEGVLE